jgi:release factor glutamine methyltransferase
MKVESFLKAATKKLEQAGIGTARLDALVLMEDVTCRDKAWLLANPESEVSVVDEAQLTKLLNLRATHLPLAYVRGKTEFYGREFIITPDVLEPRPESEAMVDELLQLTGLGPEPLIADIGTGSGALGITAKLELPQARLELIDIDLEALKVAKMNVDKFTLSLRLTKSDLLAKAENDYGVLLCNLPYVPDNFEVNEAALKEPKIAIHGGQDGLDLYRKLFKQLRGRSLRPLYILSEALPSQHPILGEIAAKAGYEELRKNDFIQLFSRVQ